MKKFAVYTAVFGKPSRFNFPLLSVSDIDKFCYTDFDIESGCHQMIPTRKGRSVLNDFYDVKKMRLDYLVPIRANRFVKICIPDEIFDNYEYSFYSDSKRPIFDKYMIDFDHFIKLMGSSSDILVRRHRDKNRDCVYEEGLYCIEIKKDTETNIMKQLNFYKSENYPEHNGLYEAMWLFRRHTAKLREFSNFWWKQIEKFTHRDQISLPYAAWKCGMKISIYKRPK
ncbi:DUF616 domain-containing protein [bacterium]|nr:DUF616 domain-containing protein [bacterium]